MFCHRPELTKVTGKFPVYPIFLSLFLSHTAHGSSSAPHAQAYSPTMIKYFFETPGESKQPDGTQDFNCLYAVIDALSYWTVDWNWNKTTREVMIHRFDAGFVSGEITSRCNTLQPIDPADLRNRFGSFAYLIERAVNGFKSYILWISPDPQDPGPPWKISNV